MSSSRAGPQLVHLGGRGETLANIRRDRLSRVRSYSRRGPGKGGGQSKGKGAPRKGAWEAGKARRAGARPGSRGRAEGGAAADRAVEADSGRGCHGAEAAGSGVPAHHPQDPAWAHLEGWAGSSSARSQIPGRQRLRKPPGRSGGLGPAGDSSLPEDSRRGTARERAQSRLAPKIPNRPRGHAQERLTPRPLPDAAHQRRPGRRGSAPHVSACASPGPFRWLLRPCPLTAQARRHLGASRVGGCDAMRCPG